MKDAGLSLVWCSDGLRLRAQCVVVPMAWEISCACRRVPSEHFLGLVSKGNQHNVEFDHLTQMESSGCFFVELLAGFCGTCQPLRNQIPSIWGPLVASVARFSTRSASPGHLRPSERETKRARQKEQNKEKREGERKTVR